MCDQMFSFMLEDTPEMIYVEPYYENTFAEICCITQRLGCTDQAISHRSD